MKIRIFVRIALLLSLLTAANCPQLDQTLTTEEIIKKLSPKLVGKAEVGQELELTAYLPEGGELPEGTTVKINWYRGDRLQAKVTGLKYKLTIYDIGKKIKVGVVYIESTKEYDEIFVEKSETVGFPIEKPVISGDAQFESELTASITQKNIAEDWQKTLQWYRDDAPIDQATDLKYKILAAEDIGKQIKIGIKFSLGAIQTQEVFSDMTEKVTTFTPQKPRIVGGELFGKTLSATLQKEVANWTRKVLWYRDDQEIEAAHNPDYVLQKEDIGKAIKVGVFFTFKTLPAVITDTMFSQSTSNIGGGIYNPQKPSITGTPSVGEVLTLVDIETSPSADWVEKIQWYRENQAISGATEAVYKVPSADLNQTLYAKIYFQNDKSNEKTKEVRTDGVFISDITVPTPPKPTISGLPIIGQTLTATAQQPPVGSTREITWYRNADLITGQKKLTYTLTAADQGANISVGVALKKGNLVGTIAKSDPTPYVPINAPNKPSLSGTFAIGQTLTAQLQDAPVGLTREIKWYRGSSMIAGASGTTYTLSADDSGYSIFVSTAFKRGSVSSSEVKSDPVSAFKIDIPTKPTIAGSVIVGQVLTANVQATPAGLTREIRWYRNEELITGHSDATYTVSNKDQGAKISVSLMFKKDKVLGVEVQSDPTVYVPISTPNKPSLSGTFAIGNTLTANLQDAPAGLTREVKWYRASNVIAGVSGTTYTLSTADDGNSIFVSVIFKKGEVSSPEVQSDPISAFKIDAPTKPIITGTVAVGQVLTATIQAAPSGLTREITWYRDGTPISGQLVSTYTIKAIDQAAMLSVGVVFKKGNVFSAETKSAPTAYVPINTPNKPSISGVIAVGQTLTASFQITPVGLAREIKWYRGTSEIVGQIATTYTLTKEDQGAKVSVGLIFKKGNLLSNEVKSDQTAVVSLDAPNKPILSGTVAVGQRLTATAQAAPVGLTREIKWYRGINEITGQTGISYALTSEDQGSKISIGVIFKKGSISSSETKSDQTIAIPISSIPNKPSISGIFAIGQTLTANLQTAPLGLTQEIKWYRGTSEIAGQTSATYTVVTADKGATLSVGLAFKKASVTGQETKSDPITEYVIPVPTKPTLSGTAEVGRRLTAIVQAAPTGLTREIKWYRGANVIMGQTGTAYTLTTADQGDNISVGVTFKKGSILSSEVKSDQTPAVPIINPTKPTLSGAVALSQKLTATVQDAPTGLTREIKWYRGTDVITGQTGTTYTLVAADIGNRVSVGVIFKKGSVLSGEIKSDKTTAVPMIIPAKPTLSGTVAVGRQLTATIQAAPTGLTREIKWYRGANAITGQTATTYTLTNADQGDKISVGVTFKKGNISSGEVKSDQTAAVSIGDPNIPTLSGTVAVGQTLTATIQATPTGLMREIKWYRGATVITGQTATTYTLVVDDIGSQIAIGVTYIKGIVSGNEVRSDQTIVVPVDAPTKPILSGTVAVGQTLTATVQAAPTGLTREIKWYRGANVITGQTATTYTLTASDQGDKISVGVVFKKGIFVSSEVRSDQTTAVPIANPTKPTLSGNLAVGQTITATIQAAPTGLTREIKWYRGANVITGQSGITYTLTTADQGEKISVGVVFKKGIVVSSEVRSDQTAAVSIANPTKPTLSGTAAVGQTLTATVQAAPTGLTREIKWYRGATVITGQTGTTYTLTAVDQGDKISVGVVFKKGTVVSSEVKSDQTTAVPIANPTKPTLSGTAAVGQTLTATVQAAPTGLTREIRWYRGANLITGQTAATYTLTTADQGDRISVGVAFKKGSVVSGEVKSDPTTAVPIANPTKPTLSGTVAVGQTLTATIQTAPTGLTREIKWYRGASLITGQTNTTYILIAEDAGTQISVGVTFKKGSVSSSEIKSDQTAAVSIANPTKPTLSGTAAVGQTLTATVQATPTGLTREIKWYRGATVITGQSGITYTLTTSDQGEKISVGVTFKKGIVSSSEIKSDQTASVSITNPTKPTLSGTAAVGQTLTATVQAAPTGLTREIKWYRGASVITGQTGTTYTLTASDQGDEISVGVIFKKGGASSSEVKSDPTAAVPITNPTKPTLSGTVAVGQRLTATVQAAPTGLTREIKWYRGASVIAGQTGTTYTLTASDQGDKISVGVIFKKGSVSSSEVKSDATAAVPITNPTKPTLSGTATVGQQLTATVQAAPTGLTREIKWYRGATVITGQTATTYTLVTADYTNRIAVGVTFKKGSVSSSEIKSDQTAAVGGLPPTAPSLSSPANNATNQSKNPTLSWGASTDPEGSAVVYDVYLDKKTDPTTKVATGISTRTYTITTPLDVNAVYYWKVEARDTEGNIKSSTVRKFTTTTDRNQFVLTQGQKVWSVAIQPNGNIAASGGEAGKITFWDATTGAKIRTVTAGPSSPLGSGRIISLEFSPDGSKLLSGGFDGKAKIWNASTGALLKTMTHGTKRVKAAWSPDGTKIVTGGYDKKTKLWNASSGSKIRDFTTAAAFVNTVGFLSNNHLVSADILGNAKIFKTDGTLEGTHIIYKELAVGKTDGTTPYTIGVRIVNANDWTKNTTWRIGAAEFVNAGIKYNMFLATLDIVGKPNYPTYGYYDFNKLSVDIPDTNGGDVLKIAFAGTSAKYVAASDDGKIRFFEAKEDVTDSVEETITVSTASGVSKIVYDVDISNDGNTTISGSADGKVKIWDSSGI